MEIGEIKMPKVSQDYINNKRESIIDAAFKIFLEKPLYEMTMLDVIKQAGLSKGGIYRYFKDIDEVIVELVNRESRRNDYRNVIDNIIMENDQYKTVVRELVSFLGKYFDESSRILGKIQFELTVMGANHPQRVHQIINNLNEQENGQYLMSVLFNSIIEGCKTNEFAPQMPIEDIFMYIRVYIEGVVKVVVLERCYGNKEGTTDPLKLMDMLTDSVLGMLIQ